MKTPSTPKKSNLTYDQAVEFLKDTPAESELSLFAAIYGKNTIQVIKIIAEEFKKRFKAIRWSEDKIISALMPGGEAVSWSGLELNIQNLCREFAAFDGMLEIMHDELAMQNGHAFTKARDEFIYFFDKIRCMIHALPKRRDYKISEAKAAFFHVHDKLYGMENCLICWRSVLPKDKQRKKKHYCYIHDLPSASDERRRRSRMKKYMIENLEQLELTVPKPFEIKQNYSIHPRDFYAMQCLLFNGHFPNIAKHLKGLGLPLNNPDDLALALEYPIPFEKLSNEDRAAWKFYLGDRGAYFELYFEHLLLAEAWLMAESNYKHGGKRS